MKIITLIIFCSIAFILPVNAATLSDALKQTYQRVTQNMFKFAPKYSSIVLNLNSNHQIKSIKYNK